MVDRSNRRGIVAWKPDSLLTDTDWACARCPCRPLRGPIRPCWALALRVEVDGWAPERHAGLNVATVILWSFHGYHPGGLAHVGVWREQPGWPSTRRERFDVDRYSERRCPDSGESYVRTVSSKARISPTSAAHVDYRRRALGPRRGARRLRRKWTRSIDTLGAAKVRGKDLDRQRRLA
jgi:hypothetical protein